MRTIARVIGVIFLGVAYSVHAELKLEGQPIQGGWMMAYEQDSSQPIVRAQLDGKPLLISPSGYMVFGFGRDAQLHHELIVCYDKGDEKTYSITLDQQAYKIQRIEGIEPRIMEPSAENLIRIEHESAAVAAARKESSVRENFLQKFIWPAKGPISGVYGSQRFYNGVPKNPHVGLDIAAPRGSWVRAPAAGKVVFAEPDLFYSGGTVIVDHGFGIFSTFIHMDSISVKAGDELKQSDKIGRVGSKGRASGPHLHWAMNWFEVRLDPAFWVTGSPLK